MTLAAPERISAAPKKDLSAISGTLAAPRNALFVPVIYKRVRFQVYTHKKWQLDQDTQRFRSTLIRINFMYFLNLRSLDYL